MDWKSKLAGFKEVPGSDDPVVFRYPARSHSAMLMLAGGVVSAVGVSVLSEQFGAFGQWIGIPMILGGILFVGLGTRSLLVARRIEIHRSAEKVLDLRRVPLKGEVRKVHDFSDILRISITRSVMDESIAEVVVIELKNGDHVDFGQYPGERGEKTAARLHELTGARITR